MKNYVQDGETLDLAAPYAVSSGGGMKVGNIFGVAVNDAANAANVAACVEGVFDLTKKAADTFSVGDFAYWDDTNKYITSTSTSNTKVGVAVAAALGADATVRVRLNESF